jgi:hypothetical protein
MTVPVRVSRMAARHPETCMTKKPQPTTRLSKQFNPVRACPYVGMYDSIIDRAGTGVDSISCRGPCFGQVKMDLIDVIGVDKQPISFTLGMKLLQEFHHLDNKIYDIGTYR